MSNLPPGPWIKIGSNVLDANRHIVAMPIEESVAELLIRAEREADETPLTIDDVERMLGKKAGDDLHFVVECGSIIEFEWHEWKVLAWVDDGGREPMLMMTLKTHGQFRTFCRLFGIEVSG